MLDANIVTGVNDSFSLKIDGLASGTINITPGDYSSTKADLATELQSRINGDSALQDAGKKVTVSYDAGSDSFSIQSDRYGSASKVEITTAHDGLGLSLGEGSDGLDVEGTIGGVEASGNGQALTGAGLAEGLKLTINGDLLGDRGAVNFTRGVADKMD